MTQRCHSLLLIFSRFSKLLSSFFKLNVLGSTFGLKLILRFNSMMTLKRYLKAPLSVLFNKKNNKNIHKKKFYLKDFCFKSKFHCITC